MAFSWKDKKDMFKGEGIYHLTFVVVNRRPLLGRIELLPMPDADGHAVWVRATDLGRAVLAKLNELEVLHPEIEIIWKTLMPDHLHAVIWAHEGFEDSIKMLARGYGQGCSKIARRYAGALSGRDAQLNCAKIMNRTDDNGSRTDANGSRTDANGNRTDANGSRTGANGNRTGASEGRAAIDGANETDSPLPEGDPYECGNGAHTLFSPPFIRTLSHKGQLDTMIKYVKSNPDNAWMRRMHPDLYVIRRNMEYAGLHFDCMGKARLLDYPSRQVIALSRSLNAEEIQHEVNKALLRAETGLVTFTGAMNKAEKAVARAVREAGFPLVVMMLDGFPPEGSEAAKYFHPGGAYHQACGEGRLYLMAPLAENYNDLRLIERTEDELKRKAEAKGFAYSPLPHSSKRWRMIAGNVMLGMIAEN